MADGFVVPKNVPPELVFEFDIYADPRVGEDVQGTYAEALKNAPDIFYTPLNGGHWMVKRYEAIVEIVRDPEYFSVREMQIPRVANPPFFIPLSLDPPDNIPYRQAMMPAFSPKAIQQMEPKLREWAVRLVEEVANKGQCDFIADISSRYPVSIFMEMMGMPLERLREFRAMANRYFNAHDSSSIEEMTGQILGVLKDQIEEKKANRGSDMISYFLNLDMEGRKLTMDEVLAMVFILYLGGMDTVTNVTGFAYQHLAQDPALQARLAANPALIPKFVEEAIRLFAVSQTPRLVIKDCERFGVQFRAGEMVLCLLALGGRDDRMLDNPALLNLEREQSPHLTFSSGPHLCIGHLLARAEIRVLTEEWLKRIPRFSAKAGALHGFRIGTVFAIESLPLEWDVAAGR